VLISPRLPCHYPDARHPSCYDQPGLLLPPVHLPGCYYLPVTLYQFTGLPLPAGLGFSGIHPSLGCYYPGRSSPARGWALQFTYQTATTRCFSASSPAGLLPTSLTGLALVFLCQFTCSTITCRVGFSTQFTCRLLLPTWVGFLYPDSPYPGC
jgi:hypothetical protein